jgi:Mg-chelatase subunit ChlD
MSPKPLLRVLLLLCLVPNLRAQNNRSQTVIVNVRDKKDEFVPSLEARNFRVEINGKAIDVVSAIAGKGVRRAVLAVDASGSMVSNHKVGTSVYEVLRSFPEETQIALVIFSDRILQTIPFGHSRQELMDAIAAMGVFKGGTALKDSLLYANSLLRPFQIGDSVILVSDGGDNKSKEKSRQLEEAYLSSGVRLGVIAILDQYLPTAEESDMTDLQNLVYETGGVVHRIDNPNQASAVRDLANELSSYYVLQVPVASSDKPSHLHIEVLDRSGKKRGGLTVNFPRWLPPALAPAS